MKVKSPGARCSLAIRVRDEPPPYHCDRIKGHRGMCHALILENGKTVAHLYFESQDGEK